MVVLGGGKWCDDIGKRARMMGYDDAALSLFLATLNNDYNV
jgi:hypothetical protein